MKLQFQLFLWLGIILVGYAGWQTFKQPGVQDLLEEIIKPQPITVLVGGDVNMGRQTGQEILAGNVDFPFLNIAETLKDADITFVNLESQLVDLGGETQSPTNEYRFAGPPEGATALNNAGIDIVSVANNHMWDYGKDALEETLDNLRSQEILYVGASLKPEGVFAPKILEAQGKRIAFFAITTLLNGYENHGAADFVAFGDDERLIEGIQAIKNDVDWILVSLHTGAEYAPKPSSGTVELARSFIDAGADAIIGHHPHVPQRIEIYRNKPVFYSLGNFAFWQPFTFWTQHSFLAKLKLIEPGEVDYELVPVKAGWQPELLTDSGDIETLMGRINGSELSS